MKWKCQIDFQLAISLRAVIRSWIRKNQYRDPIHIFIGTTTSHHLPLGELIQTFYTRIPKAVFDYFQSNDYYHCKSQLREKDFIIVLKTGEIFELSFDQRILGITKKDKDTPRNGIQLL